MKNIYPLFRDYSLTIKNWLLDLITIPIFKKYYNYEIEKLILDGTTNGGVNQHEIHLKNYPDDSKKKFMPGMTVKLLNCEMEKNNNIYLIDKIVDNVLILNKNYRKLRYEQTIAQGNCKRSPNIAYGSIDRAVSNIAFPMRQGTLYSPGISFYLTDFEYKIERSRPKENTETRFYHINNELKMAKIKPLQEYMLHYSLTIWSKYQQEMDLILYQILTEFSPEKYFWIGDPEYAANKTSEERNFKGQWVHCLLEGVADNSVFEPGDAENRLLRYDITFVMNNAFLPLATENWSSYVEHVQIDNSDLEIYV